MVIVFYPIPVFVDPKPFWLIESRPSISELIKMTETIESLSQQDLLCRNLENYAESRRGKPDMSMLAEVAEAAVAIVEMQTQPGDRPTAENSVVVEPVKVAGHIVKKRAVATSEDGGPAG